MEGCQTHAPVFYRQGHDLRPEISIQHSSAQQHTQTLENSQTHRVLVSFVRKLTYKPLGQLWKDKSCDPMIERERKVRT